MGYIMKNRKTARVIAIILALLMAFSIVFVAIDALTARAFVTQEEIDRLREEKREYERRKQEIQSQINTIEYSRRSEVAKKSVLDDRIGLTVLEIDNINATIDLYAILIIEKEIEVDIAMQMEDEQLRTYMRRVRSMEENGVITYLEIIFDSTSFSDLLARLDFISDIMRADEDLYIGLINAKLDTMAAVQDLENTKQEMEQERVFLREKQAELEEQLAEANELIAQIEETLETYTALYAEQAAEEDRIQREINRKVEELIAQEAAAAAAARVRGTGSLMWPAPSGGYVSSPYGVRMHPVHRVYMQHWGIDIPAPHGTNVIAADSGTVIISEYNSSYGNYIVISHGSMTTLYAHMSSRSVSVGTAVTKGEVIGLIGSTGVSTGAHLHFEVAINGERVDPERYV